MRRAVILHHRLPDPDGPHFDWLIERHAGENPEERALIAFRIPIDVDVRQAKAFAAERIPDHRRHYLKFEGDLSDNRGSVERIATGRVIDTAIDLTHMNLTIAWEQSTRTYRGEQSASSEVWSFTATDGANR